MRRVAVIGSGPAAAGVCLALRKMSVNVHVFDVGEKLEEPNSSAAERLGSNNPDNWDSKDIKKVTKNSSFSIFKKPQKLVFGSDYIYLKNRSLMRFKSNRQPISPTFAKGGFSRAWGGAVLPISKNELNHWPINFDELEPHFKEIWNHVPISGIANPKYDEFFPRFGEYDGLIDIPTPCEKLLEAMEKHERLSDNENFMFSRSRLMVSSGINGCINCGICLSGCPYGHIFQTDTIIDSLVKKGCIFYHKNSFVEHLVEDRLSAKITIVDIRTRIRTTQGFDKIFIAAGALGTTGIMLRSGLVKNKITILNSDKFIFPMFLKSCPGTHKRQSPSLSSIFADIQLPDETNFWIHGQISSISSYLDLKWRRISQLIPWSIVDRNLIMLTGLPSSLSSKTLITMDNDRTLIAKMIPKNNINSIILNTINAYKRSPLGKSAIIFPKIHRYLPAGGHHYGGQFPMKENPSGNQTDKLGRLKGLSSIHIVDTSVFPHIPSSTIVFTLMANAHRITSLSFK